MIEVRFEAQDDARLLTLKGHATGSPAVCAAASAMVFALAGWLKNYPAAQAQVRLKPGDGWLLCRGDETVDTALQIVLTGLAQLGASYPRHLRLTIGVNGLQAVDIAQWLTHAKERGKETFA